MDEEDFREMNSIPRGMVIKAGSTVLVRRGNGASAAVDSHVVNNAQLSYTPEIVLRRTVVRARKGDTLAALAARYDLPAATVAGWNKGHAGGALKRGQPVVMFLPVRAAAAAARDGVSAQRTAAAHAAPSRAEAQRSPAPAARGKGGAKDAKGSGGKDSKGAKAAAPPASKSARGKAAPSPAAAKGKAAATAGAAKGKAANTSKAKQRH
jgi:membrane-bound lytic murein transglycosylase D